MRTPNAHHVEGFFLGENNMISVAEKHCAVNPKARASAVIELMRREHATLSLLAATYPTECRTRGPVTVTNPTSPLRVAATAFCAIALTFAFTMLFARGIVIESDLNLHNLCKVYASDMNYKAVRAGQEKPCV